MEVVINEKSLNQVMFNISKPKKYKLNYPISIESDGNKFKCYNGIFNNEHWAVLDVIGSCIFHCKYLSTNTEVKESSYSKYMYISGNTYKYNTIDFSITIPSIHNDSIKEFSKKMTDVKLDVLQSLNDSTNIDDDPYSDQISGSLYSGSSPQLDRPIGICFDVVDLRNCSCALKSYSTKRIEKLIEELSEVKLCVNYNVSYYDDTNKHYVYKKIYNKIPSRLFRIQERLDIPYRSGGIHKVYKIAFDTILGYLFIHNILSSNGNYIPTNFYNMSKEAQLMYKNMLLTTSISYKSEKIINITYSQVNTRLRLKIPTINGMRLKVDKILNELVLNNFISGFESNKNSNGILIKGCKKIKNSNFFSGSNDPQHFPN